MKVYKSSICLIIYNTYKYILIKHKFWIQLHINNEYAINHKVNIL